MLNSKKQAKNYESEKHKKQNILSNADKDVVFDVVDTRNIVSKIDIMTQNADTGLPFYRDDARPYEVKNISKGFHRKGTGSK